MTPPPPSDASSRPSSYPPPRKRFGQHFLTDKSALRRIAEATEAGADDTVVEIGPGRGALTEILVERARRLIVVEVDRDLAAMLRARYSDIDKVLVVERDVLSVSLGELAGGSYRLVGNIPYNITTPILFHALEWPRPEVAVFLVQREVAERLAAHAGSREYGALTVNVQTVAEVESVGGISAGAFHPKPKVDSAIVRLRPLAQPMIEQSEEKSFRRFVIGLFGQRRRQIVRALRTVTGVDAQTALTVVEAAGLATASRCEDLSPGELVRLFRSSVIHSASE